MTSLDWVFLLFGVCLGFVLHAALVAYQAPDIAPPRGTIGRECLPDGTCVDGLVCRHAHRNASVFAFYGCDVSEVVK